MKHIKQYEKMKADVTYLIPSYPLEVYKLALTKIGMSPEDIKSWSDNYHAQYWDNKHYTHIIMIKSFDKYLGDYSWAWSDKDNRFNAEPIVIEIEPHELDSIKYNL